MRKTASTAAVMCASLALIVASAPFASARSWDREVRAATARFHSVEQAVDAGYRLEGPCVATPAGAMGLHYVNFGLIADPAIDPERPEVLLYAPKGGGVRLVGVEYLKADADQDLSTDGDRPFIFGQPFDGPMPGHGPGMPVHYDLHVWVWEDNPSGTFSQFNSAVSC